MVLSPGFQWHEWEALCDWRALARAITLSSLHPPHRSAEVVDFVNQKTKARIIYEPDGPAGLIAGSEEEMDRVTEFIEPRRVGTDEIQLPTQHGLSALLPRDYDKGAALAELARLPSDPRETFSPREIITTIFHVGR